MNGVHVSKTPPPSSVSRIHYHNGPHMQLHDSPTFNSVARKGTLPRPHHLLSREGEKSKSKPMFQTRLFSSSAPPPLFLPFVSSNKKRVLSFAPLQASAKKTQYCISTHVEEEEEALGLRFIRGKKLLKELSTWGIGGPCSCFIEAFDHTQFLSAIRYSLSHNIQYFIVGKGSNCLFDDQGYNGCIIHNRNKFIERIRPGVYRVGSGYPFNHLGVLCSNDGYTGLEFAAGIPATVGGAVYMNAGAYGQETSHCIDTVDIITMDGRHRVLNASDLTFGYRKSPFQQMDDLAAILSVTFRLTPSFAARERQQAFLGRRMKSQPTGERSAGSVFQNPAGLQISAGELIEKAGLKGLRIGGAKVSDIHANFFINFDGSTSKDMIKLINCVKEEVDRKFGIKLKEEIQYVPYDI